MSWAKYHIEYLRNWREAVKAIAKAAWSLGLKASVYVIGGAAENRLTVLSDVDILICLEENIPVEEIHILKKKILFKAIDDFHLPWDYPVELHIYTRDECIDILTRCGKHINAKQFFTKGT